MYVCMVCMYACYVCMYMYLCYVCVYVIYVCMCSLTPSPFWPPAQPWPSLSFHCLTTSWGFIDLYCVHPSAPDSHTRHPRNQTSLKLPVCCSSTLSPAPIPTVSSAPTLPRSHTPPWHLSAPRAHVYPLHLQRPISWGPAVTMAILGLRLWWWLQSPRPTATTMKWAKPVITGPQEQRRGKGPQALPVAPPAPSGGSQECSFPESLLVKVEAFG